MMETKTVWRLLPFLNLIYPVRIKSEDEDTVTSADWPHTVIRKSTAAPSDFDIALVAYPTWEDAHNSLCKYLQECVDAVYIRNQDKEKRKQQLGYYLSKLESAKNLKKPEL